jgi:hypothetical protein
MTVDPPVIVFPKPTPLQSACERAEYRYDIHEHDESTHVFDVCPFDRRVASDKQLLQDLV